jgi:arylsulfatase A-like enzyme
MSDHQSNSSKQPNIILINADDLGWTDLGVMGSQFYETPNIDGLASEGCLFTNAYASAPNCAPSRANMITGRYPSRHGVYTVAKSDRGDAATRRLIPVENNEGDIPGHLPTMGQALKDLGYYTGVIGKWHVSINPLDFGFDFNVAGCKKGHPPSYFSPYRIETLKDGEEGEYLPERLAGEAVKFIAEHRDNPFFLYYPTYLVHTPLEGKDEAVEKYKKKIEDGLSDERHFNPVYAAMIEELDRCVGKVLGALEDHGLSGNTLVIFTSDNGGVRTISRQNPLRAGKGSLYEGGIRVPLIVSCPGKVPEKSICETSVTNLDFYPSFVKIAGGRPEDHELDGQDISTLFWNPSKEQGERSLLWHFPAYLEGTYDGQDDSRDPLYRTRPGTALLEGDWKLHYYYEDEEFELYHLGNDLSEREDVKEKNSDVLAALSEKMKVMVEEHGLAIPTSTNPEFDQKVHDEKLSRVPKGPIQPTLSEKEWYRVMKLID